ncbi:hypothetical protein GQ600_26921 [Phytophthora cactorum]|nr:hypothetical protein GQ600_26921 [Phytophthora cactorum]
MRERARQFKSTARRRNYRAQAPARSTNIPGISLSNGLDHRYRVLPHLSSWHLHPDDIHPTDFDFLHAAMAPGVLKDATCGVDGLVKNWSLFTQWFPDIHIQLKELKTITKHSLVAFSTTSFTISAAAMQGAFPHLFQAEEGSRCAQIAARLRDQHLVLQSSVRSTGMRRANN